MRRSSLQPGQTVLVLGVGTIGILACALAKALGASRVAAVDINYARLEWVKAHGLADDIFRVLPAAPRPDAAIKSKISAQDEGIRRSKENATEAMRIFGLTDGFDIVMECTGAETSTQMGIFVRPMTNQAATSLMIRIQCARTGGKLMLVGMGTPNMSLPISAAATREVDVLGTFRYANTYPSALAMLTAGVLRGVDDLVTHRFPLDRVQDAFQLIMDGVDDKGNIVLKVIVEPPQAAGASAMSL